MRTSHAGHLDLQLMTLSRQDNANNCQQLTAAGYSATIRHGAVGVVTQNENQSFH